VNDAHIIDAVASLVAKSLISTTVINESTYYRLLDTTRAYAATKLVERDEADRIARRHAIFYSKFLKHDEIIQSLFGENDLSGYASYIGNVRASAKRFIVGLRPPFKLYAASATRISCYFAQ
jgi:predicted ATPase